MSDSAYKRISLETFSSNPGEVYLRFEPRVLGSAAFMIEVTAADIAAIARLGDMDESKGKRITEVRP